MVIILRRLVLFVACILLGHTVTALDTEPHLHVTMRMIGHKVLLSVGDSTSRVLAIDQKENKYTINFESAFAFTPDDLIPIISTIMEKAHIDDGYYVEVIDNRTDSIIYNYEIGRCGVQYMIPCRLRTQPKANYSLQITMKDDDKLDQINSLSQADSKVSFTTPLLVSTSFFLLLGLFLYNNKKRSATEIDPSMMSIGNFIFDKNNMKLHFEDQKIELSHKESELLQLFYTSINTPLEREYILNKVWGDEGDYIGRTLDVYVSKLRKKLEPDTSLKIVNIRGVGYKLVVNTE